LQGVKHKEEKLNQMQSQIEKSESEITIKQEELNQLSKELMNSNQSSQDQIQLISETQIKLNEQKDRELKEKTTRTPRKRRKIKSRIQSTQNQT